MWQLEKLLDKENPQTYINGKWVPARPINYRRKYMPFTERVKDTWEVFICRAEAFKWPEGQ